MKTRLQMTSSLCSHSRLNRKFTTTVQIPALRKNVTGTLSTNIKYLSTPSDFLWSYSLAVVDGSGNYHFLLNKDVNFMREAYPNPTATGLPKHYAYFDDNTFIVGPTPDRGTLQNFIMGITLNQSLRLALHGLEKSLILLYLTVR